MIPLVESDSEIIVRGFEDRFTGRVGCAWAVAVCSGTVALELALDILDIGRVSIPTYTCVATQHATRGRKVTYLDTHFDVKTATSRTSTHNMRGVGIVTHLFGQRTQTDPHLPAIEDWTLSLGAWPSRLIGKIGVCSTNASKMISTGRGGVVFGDDEALLERTRELVQTRSVGMSSTQAALGVSQLSHLPEFIDHRRRLAAFYSERFTSAGIECPDPDCGSVFFRYLIAVERDPAACVIDLALKGIEAGRGVYPPLHRLAGLPDDQFPGTMAAVNSLLSVPVHPSITDAEADHIIKSVIEVCAP